MNDDSRRFFAENAFRHGIAASFNQPSKLRRLKWELALMLARRNQWADAARALDDFAASNEARPTQAEAVEMQIRCLTMWGDWGAAPYPDPLIFFDS